MGVGDAPGALAAAVAEAGGLGLIGGTTKDGVPWLVNRWHGREDALRARAGEHRDEYLALGPEAEIEERPVWAGEGTSLVTEVDSAAQVVATLVVEATEVLANRPGSVLRGNPDT